MKILSQKYNIELIEINLSNDFMKLNKRPYGKKYPIECFYHLYAYKVLSDCDYIIEIEPDIYTNKKIDIDFNSIEYIGGGYSPGHYIKNFGPIMNDYKKIKEFYGTGDLNQHRITGGIKIYNVKVLQ